MILRYAVAMPCYNNQTSIDAAVCDVLGNCLFPIVIVDDGSDVPVAECLQSPLVREALASGRVTLLRHDTNLGKGAALQTAFQWALKNNKTHVLSFDSDGQHLAREIGKMITCSREHPWGMVIGSRRFAENVPEASKVGRRYSNYWVHFETGHKPLDSQSGLRVYPMFHVQNLSFFTRKYDFEIEILIRLLWKNVEVHEVEIDVYYPPPHERVTHFNKLWDNVRIVSLNVVFALVSLVRGHAHSWRSSLALGLGVLIGCTPFFGAHMAIAAAAAIAFRLNFLFLFLGSNISVPPLAPFIAMGSITIGHYILGEGSLSFAPPQSLSEAVSLAKLFFAEWLVGSLVLGSALGFVVGASEYILKRIFSKKTHAVAWTGKMRGSAFMVAIMKRIIEYCGLRTGYVFLYIIIPYFYIFGPKIRRSFNEYWKIISPEMSWFARQKEIIRHLFVYGQILVDRVYQSYSDELKFEVASEGPISVHQMSGSKRGIIFIGAHIGGWDISTLFMKKHPESSRLAMVHFLADGFTFDKVIARQTDEKSKIDSIQTQSGHGSLLTVKAQLEENNHVGFLSDRAVGTQVELIPFFGKLAPFETRPYRVAVACKAPIIFKYNFKVDNEKYLFITSDFLEFAYKPGKDRKEQVYEWTEMYVSNLETQVKRFPHQWFNFYPFWSSLPVQWQDEVGTRADTQLLEELSPKEVPLQPLIHVDAPREILSVEHF